MIDWSLVRTSLPDFLLNPDSSIYKRSNNYVVLDFETSANVEGTTGPMALFSENFLVLACWYTPEGGMRAKFGGEFDMQELVEVCENADFIVAQNAKFELQWLDRCGLDLTNVLVFDTKIAEYVIGGNRWQHRRLSLDSIAEARLNARKMEVCGQMYKAKMCSSDIPASWLLRYCRRDVTLTDRVFKHQLAELEDKELLDVMYTRCLLTPVLSDLEKNGMFLDSEMVNGLYDEAEREYNDLNIEMERITGGINFNSGKQLGEFLYEQLKFQEVMGRDRKPLRTAKDAYRTDKDTIAKLKPTNAAQREFLDLYRKINVHSTNLSKYLRKFKECVDESGGFMQGEFNQCNTATHRLSSSGLLYKCQFQNFPRTYKPVFKPRHDDWLMGEADGSQLEFRVAAHLGRDEVALNDIATGTDIHKVTASVLNNVSEDEVTKEQRQDAKADTFKPLYGGKSGTPDQQRYYKFFGEKYAGIAATQQEWIYTVLEKGELTTEWGMRYYWPDTRMERSGFITNSQAICNYPVQAFATAEIIPIVLVYFWHYLKRTDLKMLIVNTVHDSIIMELPPEEGEEFKALSSLCFIDEAYRYLHDVYGVELVVPLATEVCIGPRWSKGEETTFEADLEDIKERIYVTV